MKDIQNIKGDFKYKINKVGVNNVLHPVTIKTKEEKLVSTVGIFTLAVSLDSELKGINMSRLPVLLAELSDSKWVFEDLRDILDAMRVRMGSTDAYMDVEFDYFLKKKAPVSGFEGLMPYRCKIEAALNSGDIAASQDLFDFILSVEVPITTLCPCSKEISDFSAHNQRGYVQVSVRYNTFVWIEDIINMVEAISSCEIYPILKRADEKFVTEKAYENPRFVEDIVRLAAERLNADSRIDWFRVNSRHQESIHPHDAFAQIEVWK